MRTNTLASLALAVSGFFAATVNGAALHVAPVNVRMEVGQRAAGLTLTNMGDRPLVAQVRVYAWSQDESEDHLTEQQDVVASPPLVTIQGQGEQLVRIVRLDHANPTKELNYRLIIDELPQPGAVEDAAVDIRLRYSVPLFVAPAKAAPMSLAFNLDQRRGQWWMEVHNAGGMHAQLSAVSLLKADGSKLGVADGLLGYALAGNTRAFPLPLGAAEPTERLRLKAMVNGTPIEVSLPSENMLATFARR